jgi:hypothetical protein
MLEKVLEPLGLMASWQPYHRLNGLLALSSPRPPQWWSLESKWFWDSNTLRRENGPSQKASLFIMDTWMENVPPVSTPTLNSSILTLEFRGELVSQAGFPLSGTIITSTLLW